MGHSNGAGRLFRTTDDLSGVRFVAGLASSVVPKRSASQSRSVASIAIRDQRAPRGKAASHRGVIVAQRIPGTGHSNDLGPPTRCPDEKGRTCMSWCCVPRQWSQSVTARREHPPGSTTVMNAWRSGVHDRNTRVPTSRHFKPCARRKPLEHSIT